MTRSLWWTHFAIGFFTFLSVIFFGVPCLYFLFYGEWGNAMEMATGISLTLLGAMYFHQKYAT